MTDASPQPDRSANRRAGDSLPTSTTFRPSRSESLSDYARSLAAGIALLAILVRVWIAWKTHSTTEDFYITLRYAEHLARGQGFVYTPGERVLGTTTPLYTLFLALVSCLRLDPVFWGKAANILADGGTCYLLARLLARREIAMPVAGLFASLLYALSSTPISISIGGMETGIVTFVGMGMTVAYVSRATRTLCLGGALLFLLRIDGLLLFGLLLIGVLWRERRLPWRPLLGALALTLPWLAFATLYFGSPVPTSLIAKLLVYGHGMAPPRAMIEESFRTQFLAGGFQKGVTALFVVGAVAIVLPCLQSKRKPAHEQAEKASIPGASPGILALPLLWLLLYYGTMYRSPVPAFPWYFLPPWPLFLGIALLGAGQIGRLLARRMPVGIARRIAQAWPIALLAYGLFGLAHLRAVEATIAQAQQAEDELRIPIGLWFRANARENERILLEPIGYIGYFSRRPILDMIGLVSPEVFPSYRTSAPLSDIVRRLRPEWLCLRPHEREALDRGDPRLILQYRAIRDFERTAGEVAFTIYRRREDSGRPAAQ